MASTSTNSWGAYFVLTLSVCVASAQVPPWVLQTPGGYAFDYTTGSSGVQETRFSALQIAEQMAMQALMQKQGRTFASIQSTATSQGNLQGNLSRSLVLRTELNQDPMLLDRLDVIARSVFENGNVLAYNCVECGRIPLFLFSTSTQCRQRIAHRGFGLHAVRGTAPRAITGG